MKKLFYFIGIAAMAFAVAACQEDKPDVDVNNITEDGFYVIGEATGQAQVTAALSMAKGINEANNQTVREGMFEKYIVLQGGKDFTLTYVNGGKQTAYGATLAEFKPAELTGIYDSNPADKVFKGKLVIGDAAPKMKVEATGLYHIVLDLNTANDLADAQILLCPVTMGVRGGMNSWGFTALEATEAKNEGITFTLTGQKLAEAGEFKFAYNSAWKITLDEAGAVKANTNLGKDCVPGGDNIAVTEGAGLYKITLNYKLAAGDIKNSFNYKVEQESAISAPTTMFMIGDQFGGWDWASDGVAELVPVWGTTGCFWATRYFQAGKGFKFCGEKAWNGDFGKFADDGSIIGDNNTVETDGFYTVYVDYVGKSVVIAPAEVYGIGASWIGGNGWDYNAPDAVLFEAEGNKLSAVVTNANEAVRIASKVVPVKAGTEGITGNGWFDWWKTEFIFFDGKIAYRGLGGDQEAVKLEANTKVILDLNAGTVELAAATPFVPAVTIDGNFDDWASVASATEGNHTIKITSDEKNVYFYSLRAKEGRYSEIWGSKSGYVYIGVDGDNNMETGVELWGNGPYEFVGVFYPYAAAGTFSANPGDACMPDTFTLANATCAGKESDAGAEVEICVPRKDLPAFPATEMTIYAWGNKDLTKVSIKATL